MRSEGEVTVTMAVDYDYSDPTISVSSDYFLSTAGAASYYDKATFDSTDIYDGNPSPVERTTIAGSAKSVSIRYVTNDQNPSHTIQAITLTYGLGDRR
jgi:polyisoprenoid-binding protein YceI